MKRRGFLKNAALAGTAAMLPSAILEASDLKSGKSEASSTNPELLNNPGKAQLLPISKVKKPVAIAMWDFSWILRHHKYGEFQNWDRVLEELAERGYNAIRMDAMPQFVASTKEGKIIEEFRSPKKDWVPALWGNDFAMDFHVWFHHNGMIGGHIGTAANTAIDRDLRTDYAALMSCWKENKKPLVEWIDTMITSIAKKAADNKIVCGNTEGWGPIGWYDHPDLPWDWVKESAEICVDLAKEHNEYKFICTSNFTHPQFSGMWEDISWHRMITDRIRS